MDQNKKNKVKDFFRKEGFYLVLFVCLCIVATVAAFTIRKNSVANEQNKANNELSLNEVEDNTSSETDSNFNKQNAERVENNDELANSNEESLSEPEVVNAEEEVAINDQEEVAENQVTEEEVADVSAGTDTQVVLSLPIDGSVAISREFGTMIRIYVDETRSEDISRRGIDINASVGTIVKAAAEGQVEEVASNTTDGTYVVIAHANGLKTKYANLSEEVKVAVGDVVSTGTEIGTVGNTSGIFTSKVCGDVLNVQVQDANGKDVDPSAYFDLK